MVRTSLKTIFREIDYKMFFAIFLTLFIPSIYKVIRIHILGSFPDANNINIASQLSWINLIYEVIQEGLILPLFFLLGKANLKQNNLTLEQNSDNKTLSNRIKTSLITISLTYILIAIIVIIFAKQLVVLMGQNLELIDQTVTYVRLETISALFLTIWRFIVLVFNLFEKDKYIYLILLIQSGLSITFDVFLVSQLNFSLNIGVIGIPITNIIVNTIIVVISLFLINKITFDFFKPQKLTFRWLLSWFKVGSFSGIESLIRNLVFSLMIIRMINLVAQQGNYWIANSFIWDLLLLPTLALADVIKKDVANQARIAIKEKTFSYLILISIFVALWLVFIPVWKPLLKYVYNVDSYETVFYIVLIQTGFYITFMFNTTIFDSTFYGLGKTNYMLFQSLCIDIGYYGMMFILYTTGVFVPSLLNISIMFGCGMLLDFIPSMILYIYLLKKHKIKILFFKREQFIPFVIVNH
ncbi:MATE family Na+-driven efflux transporter [Mycoplasma sp. E35C]|uniref:MATE family Na+-driven efflux transporter n=1 Tax=Mycoplasma sp. E35C TaxID=2801918 RepID=UPI001CA469BC|nr:MATE family Na+-driven efflux transporter [Mycoplasma sp. E35C]QZX49475.1 hypothetical protein JJE79_01880 [Mycoplasma sp. E35C]